MMTTALMAWTPTILFAQAQPHLDRSSSLLGQRNLQNALFDWLIRLRDTFRSTLRDATKISRVKEMVRYVQRRPRSAIEKREYRESSYFQVRFFINQFKKMKKKTIKNHQKFNMSLIHFQGSTTRSSAISASWMGSPAASSKRSDREWHQTSAHPPKPCPKWKGVHQQFGHLGTWLPPTVTTATSCREKLCG